MRPSASGIPDRTPIADSRAAVKAATAKTRLIERPGESHMFTEKAYPEIAAAIADWLKAT